MFAVFALARAAAPASYTLESAPWRVAGDADGDRLGFDLAAAGDVDGDGYGDLLVGAHTAAAGAGEVRLYRGGPAGPGPTPSWTRTGSAVGVHFGRTLAGVGDVTGDGYDDVLVGEARNPSGPVAQVFPGGPDGLGEAPVWTVVPCEPTVGDEDQLRGAGGDVNGDGWGDLLLGATGHVGGGGAWLYLGGPQGLSEDPAWGAVGGADFAVFGGNVGVVGDTDGDGSVEVAVGAHNTTVAEIFNAGEIRVYRSGPEGLATEPDRVLAVPQAQSYFGVSFALPGDLDGDGLADLVAGAHTFDPPTGGLDDAGAAFLFPSATGEPTWTVYGTKPNARLGLALAGGDVDGDGLGDVLVPAPLGFDDADDTEGRVSLFLGAPGGPTVETEPVLRFEGEIPGAQLGWASALADLDGDGCRDVVLGAPNHEGEALRGMVGWWPWAADGRTCLTVPVPPRAAGPAPEAPYSGIALGCATAPGPGSALGWLALALGRRRRAR